MLRPVDRLLPRFADDEPAAAGRAAVERSAIPENAKWRLESIFPDWEAWQRAFAEVQAALPDLAARQGSLGRSGADLLGTMTAIHDVQRRLETVVVYASMRSDEDTRIGDHLARKGRASSLGTSFAETVSWFEPELLALTPETVAAFVAAEPGLRLYEHHLDTIQRLREHTLDERGEALLAGAGNITRAAGQIFTALTNADMRLPTIEDEQRRPVELTQARFSRYLKSPDRRVRRDTFRATLGTYGKFRNTLAATLDAAVTNHVFYAESRGYPSCLHASLHPNAIPVEVYRGLIREVRAHLPTVHRYTALKHRVLRVHQLEEHDLYVPLFTESEFKFGYEEAQDLLLQALAPLGPQYLEIVRGGYREGWIDVHENLGKRSGAYSSGVYDTQPFILLNWSDQLSDTFTLAHEMGHSVHTWLASKHQPYVYGDYPIFTAEVASTCNEMLLLHHLLEDNDDRGRRLYLLDHHLAQITGTVVRQTMFAEFELRVHEMGEQRQTLTADGLGEIYLELLRDYWGPGVTLDPELSALTWARIPHFYYNFYVYQYATAYAAAVAFSRAIQRDGEPARERYLDVLRAGNSRYPVDTLRRGGVDMTTTQPFADVFALYSELVSEIEELLPGGR